MMKKDLQLLSPDGSSNRNPPERCPCPLYSWDSTQEDQEIPQDEGLIVVKVEVKEEGETHAMADGEEDHSPETGTDISEAEEDEEHVGIKEEEVPVEISTDGRYKRCKKTNAKTEDEDIISDPSRKRTIALNFHQLPQCADLSSGPSPHGECSSDLSHQTPHKEGETAPSSPCSGKVLTEQESEIKPFSCSECGKGFTSKGSLIRHTRVHTGEKPYTCSECGKCFSLVSSLIKHERIHTGEKPFTCPECGKCFRQKTTAVMHQRTHTGVKPFVCSECGKSFPRKRALMRHQPVHTREKPFSCPECGKCFPLKDSVIRHQKCHTGEKPFSCTECGRCFSSRQKLSLHQRTHTGEKPYSCSECGSCFSCKRSLMRHQSIHTGEKSC